VPLIVSHMFVFYFGIMADLTPPVALAAFAAAPIAKESGHEDRLAGGAIAIAGFIVPYMAVYSPALMLQGDLLGPLNMVERVFAATAAFMLVAAIPLTDEIGFGMSVAFAAWHLVRIRRNAPQ
jgi:TRAP-type uncharacterized transport system fused permease subunit